MKVCVVGASGKLGRYMLRHALECGHEVVGVCREQSVDKLAESEGRITVVPGPTDAAVIKKAVAGCDGVLVVLVPRGMHHYSSGTAQAVLDHAEPDARLSSRAAGTSASTVRTSTASASRHSSRLPACSVA
jgi:nucleoside-diphosphate-sugar epimerase